MRRCVSALLFLGVLAFPAGAAARTDAPRPPAPPTGAALAALAQPPTRTAIASERLYFVMPDRYRNGNTANDRGGVSGTRSQTGYDPTDPGWFHGGDFVGLTGDCGDTRTGLARLRELGFTAIWVTPPYKQKYVQGSSAAYHGYWILDFTTVDPHLGTEAEFGAFVECAHRLGLKVYLDVVVNHTADVILPTGGSGWVGPGEVPYRDCRGRRFNPAAYALRRTFPCLRASAMPRVPVVQAEERNAKRPVWLNDVTRYHNRGDVNFASCSEICFEMGDFFGLDDLFTEQWSVADGLGKVYGDWIRRFKVDGFRIDTARHVNAAFFKRWIPQIRAAARQAGVKDFEIFGEVFDSNAINLSTYVRERGLPNLLDFSLQDAVASFASGQTGSRGIASRLADDDYFQGPNGVAHTPPTFAGNHDMGRAAQQIKSRSQASGDTLVRRVNLAYSLLYLLRGAPVVYYGDEVGMIGSGGDKAARQDMFPTQVREWKTEERAGGPAIGEGSSFDVQGHPIGTHLTSLAQSRVLNATLSTGSTHVRLAQGGVLVVSRFDAREQVEHIVGFNAGQAPATVTVQTSTPSATFVVSNPYPFADRVTSDSRGRLNLTIPALSSVVRNATVSVAPAPPPRPTVTAGRAEFADLIEVRGRVSGTAPVSVAFAVRRAKGRWARVGVDDSPPYRAMLDPRRYRRGERIHLVAVARGLDGRTAVSRVTPFVVPRRAS